MTFSNFGDITAAFVHSTRLVPNKKAAIPSRDVGSFIVAERVGLTRAILALTPAGLSAPLRVQKAPPGAFCRTPPAAGPLFQHRYPQIKNARLLASVFYLAEREFLPSPPG